MEDHEVVTAEAELIGTQRQLISLLEQRVTIEESTVQQLLKTLTTTTKHLGSTGELLVSLIRLVETGRSVDSETIADMKLVVTKNFDIIQALEEIVG